MSDHPFFVLRIGEIFLKGRNRPQFVRQLVANVRRAVEPLGARVDPVHGRIFVHATPEHRDEVSARLSTVFGLTSISPARPAEPELDVLTAAAEQALEQALAAWSESPRPTFKVETRRSDKRFPMPSPDISRAIGGALHERFGLPVRLQGPDLTVEVEIGRQRSFVTTERIPGAGGLPVGSSGRVELLLSGGIDSPVAGWLLAKRGCRIHPITFESPPYTGPDAREKIVDLCRRLARWTGPLRLRVVRFTETQLEIQRRCPPRMAVVLYRRMMFRAAEAAAERDRALALGTGESIGQVASQTLENLHAIADVARLPVLRPLGTFDKAETIAQAQRIGTYDISIRPHVDCCSLFVPDHPETRAHLDKVEEAEAALGDVRAMTEALTESTEVVTIEDPYRA